MPEEKKQLTYEELMEQLKDPSILHALAAKHGMRMVKEGEQQKEEVPPPKKVKERPKLVIPEDAEIKDVIAAMAKHSEDLSAYYEELLQSKSDEVRGEIKQTEERRLLKEVREFAAKHKDFDSLVPIIQPLVSSGKYQLEEAYNLARKAKGLPEEKPANEQHPPKRKPSSFSTADEGGERSTELKPKVTSIRDAAKNNLSKILAEFPDGEKALSEDPEVEDPEVKNGSEQ